MTKERELAYIALMAAFIVALRFIPAIQLSSGVPITAQSLGVMLAGTLLGAKRGFLAVLLFVFLAILGLPVLASGIVGLSIFQSPTVGFVLGFPIAAFVTGWVAANLSSQSVFVASVTGALIGSVVVLYALGILGLSLTTQRSFVDALVIMTPFIPGDIAKALIAGVITRSIAKLRPEWVLTR